MLLQQNQTDMNKGILKELNHGFRYGYIKCSESGKSLFCKLDDFDYDLPKVNDVVSFDLIDGYNSELAINVKLYNKLNSLNDGKPII